jgi:hypothetical protein
VEYISTILNFGIRVVNFMSQTVYPQENDPSTDWMGGWVDPKADLDLVEKRSTIKKLRGLLRQRTIPTERPAKLMPTLAFSATNPYCR